MAIKKINKSSASKTSNLGKKFALLSVFDKTGIVEFAKILIEFGFTIVSTGGTAKALTDNYIKVTPIQEITGNPESFDGRMKTISFQIEGGILFDRKNPNHVKEASKLKVPQVDIVVANLYPFEQTISKKGVKMNDAIESIDVGGPTMIRSAAKNFKNVIVITDPKDYKKIASAMSKKKVDEKIRQNLAAKAFDHLSFYDSQIAKFLRKKDFPEEIALAGRNLITLRYGENPHQKGSVYFEPNTNSPMQNLTRLTGRSLSYVNFTDIASGLESIRMFKESAAVIIKHNSACGIALGDSISVALKRAVEADPESAFGGVIVLNNPLDINAAKIFASFKEEDGVLIDIVSAPNVTKEAQGFIKDIRKSTGIYTFGKIPNKRNNPMHLKYFDGGFIMQDWDDYKNNYNKDWKVVTKIKPTKQQMEQMKIAWKFTTRIRSNTILILDKELPMTRGIGSGQTSRIRSTKIALEQANKHVKGAILSSDSFFPFDDSVRLAAKAGIGAIVQQGGSVNDELSIKAANEAGIPMVFTYRRAFWH